MSLICIEGFESRSPRTGWFLAYENQTQPGRYGGICASNGSNHYYLPPVALDDVVMGFALKLNNITEIGVVRFAQKSNNNTGVLRVHVRADHSVAIHRYHDNGAIDVTPLIMSSGPIGDVNQWVYVEIKAKMASVGGYIQVRVNGTEVVRFVGDTQYYGGDTRISKISFDRPDLMPYDDVYICDTTGTEFNDFLGEVQVEGLVPNGNGAFSQLAGSDGDSVDNYLLVDETPASENDIVSSATVGARDTYQFTNPTVTSGQILAIQPSIAISKLNAGPAGARVVERLANGAERESDVILATNLLNRTIPPRTRDPEGAVWTPASVAAAEFGVEVA